MKEQCFDEGTIQSFLDGELAPELLENVACHVALCDSCALLLSEAEEESAFAFSALDEEFNLPVPTERIRANVFEAIANIEQPRASIWEKIRAFTSILSNPSIAAFASLLVVAGIFAVVLNFNKPNEGFQVAVHSTQQNTQKFERDLPIKPIVEESTDKPNFAPKFEKVAFKPEVKTPIKKKPVTDHQPLPTAKIDGEDTYLKTIATLENTVKDKKDRVLRASSRVSFERDMAVVDDSIKRMKDEVRKNPKNEAAKQILRNSYQNKIDLLNSVSERSELIARMD